MKFNFRVNTGNWVNRHRISRLAYQVASRENQILDLQPVIFFNVSSRLRGLSLNAAFSLLTSWCLRLIGVPVKHYVCSYGMSHCVLGTNRENYRKPPPCKSCVAESKLFFNSADVRVFRYHLDTILATRIKGLSVKELSEFEYPLNKSERETPEDNSNTYIPLGQLVLPSIRWALRRHNLLEDDDTRYLLQEYILSAYSIAQDFSSWVDEVNPSCVVIFNGIMYPEATARWLAIKKGIRVITHEVGFLPHSAFFSEGQATAYPISIPEKFELSINQNARLDEYLNNRFQGNFTMAGIQFWPEMRGLDEDQLQMIAGYKSVVPVFTNVVYDTSQIHANRIFPHMFTWLEAVLELVNNHPETLFIIRAHPDEMRPGTAKQSRESVKEWVARNGVDKLENVVYIDSLEYVSSYELIKRAKFVLVYNSSIGLEAVLLGKTVLCGGVARYSQYPTVYLPDNPDHFSEIANQLLQDCEVTVPDEFIRNARRFLYYQLFLASLPFKNFLQSGTRKGFVVLKPFNWSDLLPQNSTTMKILVDGIVNRSSPDWNGNPDEIFLMPEMEYIIP